ncbi:MAG: M4 family metallopeptidase [Flavobacteriales bacterium]|nr:MAG: M4 family metallopeptidase [Flavobacteriales bacterium]
MKQTRTSTILFLAFALGMAFSFSASAQQIATRSNERNKAFPDRITFHEGMSEAALVPALEAELGWPTGYGLTPQGRPVVDKLGYSHQRYQQFVGGIPVFGATVAVHSQNGQLRSMNGELLSAKVTTGDRTPSLDPQAAIESAERYVGATSYMWGSPEMEAFIKREQHDPEASFKPKAELVYYPLAFPKLTGELRLVYKLDVYALSPRSRQEVLVDARTGEVFASFERMHSIDEPGTAQTAYSGTRPIITYRPSASGPYQLEDHSRGGGIITYDCLNTADYSVAIVPSNPVNDWDLGSLTANSILDAHWGTERTYDFYHNEQNWDSYDNNDSPMLSYVHFNLIEYGYSNNNNAFWDGERMTYGDGDGTTFNPLTVIDVAGHEITHGVTENSAGLVYEDEPGALNESFSDIMGSCIEHYAKPGDFSWELGDEMSLSGTGFRNLADPNANGDPDTYLGDYWYSGTADHGGVHTNSGVQNFWFYLLSEGGAGTNDNADVYNVQGIGIEEAGDIAFRSLTMYMTSNSEYADARANSIQAATDLFGACSPELIAVTNAWYAVGVGAPFNDAVLAGFTLSANYSCMAPATVQFTNGSFNAASYLWDFGDGTTSTLVSPSHTYATTGSYTVSLIALGSTQCNSTDTLVMDQPIVVEDLGELAPAACQPAATNPASDAGIFRVQFGNIDKTSTGAVDGYQDFSCEQVATVIEGMSYPLSVELHLAAYAAVWIDLNNDGAFTAAELLYTSNGQSLVHAADVIIPAGTVFGTRLRARVISSSQPITTACTVTGGQAEDYSVIVLDNDAPPIAAFTADPLTVLPGSTVSFQDLSLNAPTQWTWAFEGGDVTSSTAQNPQVSYSTVGYYDVQLIVANAHGSDTLLIPDFIRVVNSFNLCEVSNTGAFTGTFYDPEGETADYLSNEFCTLLIAPPCASSITVSFDAFRTESGYDFLNFYDGADALAPSLGQFSGSTIPASFTTTGGQLFVAWTSDQSVTDDGFAVNWTAQIGSQEDLTTIAAADDMNPAYGQSVQFSDNSLETPSAWNWDFGDGTSSVLQNPVHTYLTSGAKTVVLTASNCASTDQDTLYLQVQVPGTIATTPDTLFLTGTLCEDSLYGSFTLHNTGGGSLSWTLASELTDDFEAASYNADLWASSTGANSADCDAEQGSLSHRFSAGGTRSIQTLPLPLAENAHFSFFLKYGSGGACETVEAGEYVVLEYSLNGTAWTILESYATLSEHLDWAMVDAVIPAAAASGQTRLRLRQVDNSGATYDVWAIDQVSLEVGYSGPFQTNPDQGEIPAGDSTVVSVTIPTYATTPGTSLDLIQVRSSDPALPSTEVPVSITILDLPCAEFNFSYNGPCQSQVQFTNSTINGGTEWHWDFGDGTSSEAEAPMHAYMATGDYTVVLTAGTPPFSTQYTMVVHVEDPVTAQIAHTDPNDNNGAVDFSSTGSGATGWLWDFGDGGSSAEEAPAHTYAAYGTYTVILAAMNDAGCTVMDTIVVEYGTVGILQTAASTITVMPNPSNGHFTVRLSGISGTARGRMTDATGRTVSSERVFRNGENAVDISELADGSYILRLQIGEELRHVRITKQ